MTKKTIFPVVVTFAMLLSCTNHDLIPGLQIVKQEISMDTLNVDSTFLKHDSTRFKLDSTFQYCDSVFIATYHGTACCVSGPMVAKPGDIFQYHYQINFPDAHVSWEIFEGDISIVSGQDTQTVTVQFGATFTKGIVHADGDGLYVFANGSTRLRCMDHVTITSD